MSGAIIISKYFKQVVINPESESMHSEDLSFKLAPCFNMAGPCSATVLERIL